MLFYYISACAFLTPHFAYIPTAALSAVIICAMIFTIEVEVLLPIWRSKKIDMIPFTLTFLIGLFVSPEMGMIVGSCSHLCILIYTSGTPKVSISKRKVSTNIVRGFEIAVYNVSLCKYFFAFIWFHAFQDEKSYFLWVCKL